MTFGKIATTCYLVTRYSPDRIDLLLQTSPFLSLILFTTSRNAPIPFFWNCFPSFAKHTKSSVSALRLVSFQMTAHLSVPLQKNLLAVYAKFQSIKVKQNPVKVSFQVHIHIHSIAAAELREAEYILYKFSIDG